MFDPTQFMSTFNSNKLNGFDVMIMQSAENVETVMKFYARYNMPIMLETALDQLGLSKRDFVDSDYKKLESWVQKTYR